MRRRFFASAANCSPAARFHLEANKIDALKVIGTSKHGIISKADVLNYLAGMKSGRTVAVEQPAATVQVQNSPVSHASSLSAPVLPSTVSTMDQPVNSKFEDIPNNNIRKVIAKRLTQSKQTVPHSYSAITTEMNQLLKFRAELKKNSNVNVSVNDIVIKAAALALRDVPEANAMWNANSNAVAKNASVDISVAVATPNGLITPIVKNADRKGLFSINTEVKDLATRAKDGKLKPEEFQGGTFTISNLGTCLCTPESILTAFE